MDEHDAQLSRTHLELVALLEHLYDNGGAHSPDHLDRVDLPRDRLKSIVAAAEVEGYVSTHPSIRRTASTVAPTMLLGAGSSHVEEIRTLRGSRAVRGRACRNALLRWMYDEGVETVDPSAIDLASDAFAFFGVPFSDDDVQDAAKYLLNQGLLGQPAQTLASGDVGFATLTAEGQRCVEDFDADVRQFLGRQSHGRGDTYAQIFNAPTYGQVAQGREVEQTQIVVSPSDFDDLATELVVALSRLGSDDDRSDLLDALDSLKEAATVPVPSPEEVGKRGAFLHRQAGRIGDATVTAAASGLVQFVLRQLGAT